MSLKLPATIGGRPFPDTQDLNGRENTSFLINIVKQLLLRLYRLLQIERGLCRAGIAETCRQGACELIPGRNGR